MKLSIQYLNDQDGNISAVQIPWADWEKITLTMKKYKQALKLKSDLAEAFGEVRKIQAGEIEKQTLSELIDEL